MTSIRDLVSESLAVGETFCLTLERRDGDLVASHPNAGSPMDLLVCEGLELLPERPPSEPVEVEVVGRVVEGRLVGRVVGLGCGSGSGSDSSNGTEETGDEDAETD